MSAILNGAESLNLSHNLSISQAKSQAGKRQAQQRGPYLYNITVQPHPMGTNSTKYLAIQTELRSIGYGTDTINTKVHSTITADTGSWATTTTIVVDGASQTGNKINLDGFTASTTDAIKDGDYVQFGGSSKVYQVIGDYDSDTNGDIADVKLNCPLVKSPGDDTTVVHGEDVLFTFALVQYGDPVLQPQSSTSSIAYWPEFLLEEVVQ